MIISESALSALKKSAEAALSRVGCGYIYGATGWVCTQSRIEQQAKQYPEYAEKIYKYGPKWIGKRCYDCAQLTRVSVAEAGVKLPSGATSQWNTKAWAHMGTINALPKNIPGVHLFIKKESSMSHTGISLGDGTAVEAQGHAYGVVRRALSAQKWTHWAIPAVGGMELIASGRATIQNGSKGALVTELQELLIEQGYNLPKYGADGSFGSETQAALKKFQTDQGLTVDGICGPLTWAALLNMAEVGADGDDGSTDTSEPVEETDTVTITLPRAVAQALSAALIGKV